MIIPWHDLNQEPVYEARRSSTASPGPLVVDQGSWQFRAGLASETGPSMIFSPIVHRVQRGEEQMHIVGQAPPTGYQRTATRTPFDEAGLPVHLPTLEHIYDHLLGHYGGVPEGGILATEPLGCPPYWRHEVGELFFEAYGAPRVAFVADIHCAAHGHKDALVLSFGNASITVLAVLDGSLVEQARIDFGGAKAADSMLRWVQLKYPAFPQKLTLLQAQELVHKTCQVALDYRKTLAQDPDQYTISVQFPFHKPDLTEQRAKEAALAERRREQMAKMRERMEAIKLEKLEVKKHLVDSLQKLDASIKASEALEEDAIRRLLKPYGYRTVEELEETLELAREDLRAYQNKLAGVVEELKKVEPDYSLLTIPDDQLDSEQLAAKRRQRLLKASADARERQRIEKEAAQQREEARRQAIEQKRLTNFSQWRSDLYEERRAIMGKLRSKQRAKEALADRRSTASGKRLKSVMSLADDAVESEEEGPGKGGRKKGGRGKKKVPEAEKEDDGFGEDDADWLIYRQISRGEIFEGEGEEDGEEAMRTRLGEIEAELEQYDPQFYEVLEEESQQSMSIMHKLAHPFKKPDDLLAEAHQLHLNVERFRVAEIPFQPSIIGIDQAGLVEVIDGVFRRLGSSLASRLAANILLTGGLSRLPNLKDRLEQELQTLLPAGTSLHICHLDPHLAAWKGAAAIARSSSDWITRTWYEEHGSDRLPSLSDRFQ